MPSRHPKRSGESSTSVQQQLPFTGEAVDDAEFSGEGPAASDALNIASPSSASSTALSTSYTQRTPARSFFHHASYSSADTPQYSSHGVRERTQALAAYALDSDSFVGGQNRPRSYTSSSTGSGMRSTHHRDTEPSEGRDSMDTTLSHAIEEDPELESPLTVIGTNQREPSPFTPQSPQPGFFDEEAQEHRHVSSNGNNPNSRIRVPPLRSVPSVVIDDSEAQDNSETTPLLPKARLSRTDPHQKGASISTGESYATAPKHERLFTQVVSAGRQNVINAFREVANPKNYTKKAVTASIIGGLNMLSAVFLGLLLNVLDGLSYGMILFPLGEEIFKGTEADGISIFFVSCIVSQLCYSLGLSIFKGGVGSEMIEVVPFFHKMAYSIINRMKGESPQAIMATVITAYSLSSIVTGLIFLALGCFKLGNLVSFFPRNILIGCIGGVGFFLAVTGVEVSARLGTSVNYDLATLKKLFQGDTFPLWITPLALAILVLVLRRRFKSPFVLPGFFIAITAVFYIIVASARINLDNARSSGWVFAKPPSGVPFYHFYSYFNFRLVDFPALASTIPAMFALSFFGIIHVPINVPALGVAVKEDNVSVNRELIAHGISNTLSGCIGSIQNYLVYANSILFIENGGDSRGAGLTLAAATTAVWMAGPAMIGFIPVCIVGALIFMLGIELLEEAVWDTYGKLHRLEYLTIIAIVLIMGVYDFVVGIVVGIVLACLSYVVQSSRTPAIRASYSGEVAESTVRRPRTDRRYLNQVCRQIRVEKLSGMLFFGTIVAVEKHLRALIEDEAFKMRPVSFIIVDFNHVTGLDFSAAEGFQRINRILCRKHVKMVLSGVSFASDVGKSLDNVGLLSLEKADADCPPPEVFEDLNMALEACENHLLTAFYKHRNRIGRKGTPPMSIYQIPNHRAVPQHILKNTLAAESYNSNATSIDPAFQSPRREAQIHAADTTLRENGDTMINENDTMIPSKWKHFAQPIKIMLQTFEDVSDKNEDFWHRAAPFFQQRSYAAGVVLYSRGDDPDGFYILEQGRLRAEYDLEQGNFYEVILPGTTCGELPFFSETDRTGTVAAENDSVAWLLTREKFNELESKEPQVANELLKMSLKLTKERMDAITS
ncbi:uncharacterized protein BDZ99DRAFT_396839 [Mytilinidion resinicola]|uniref:Sulfate transporter family protein-like protein n=1 Tax=Mytilinidion resinicola TaxID=574789 RepID=A0A6A6Y7K8_9PEZI|nr:uncharacterized protein BDZ99DRAFT_396839 [Mytilinidion resinicola]KAF2804806.1 hypothetical protein BDZ99DRAFT_396839 [Mytilinidion resinicola]